MGGEGVFRAGISQPREPVANVSRNDEYRACGRIRRTMSGSDLKNRPGPVIGGEPRTESAVSAKFIVKGVGRGMICYHANYHTTYFNN